MDRDEAEVANERIATMAEELRKAELGRTGSWALTQKTTTCVRAWGPSTWSGRSMRWRKIFGSLPTPPTSRRHLRPRRQRF
jgi:hypothetical protein